MTDKRSRTLQLRAVGHADRAAQSEPFRALVTRLLDPLSQLPRQAVKSHSPFQRVIIGFEGRAVGGTDGLDVG